MSSCDDSQSRSWPGAGAEPAEPETETGPGPGSGSNRLWVTSARATSVTRIRAISTGLIPRKHFSIVKVEESLSWDEIDWQVYVQLSLFLIYTCFTCNGVCKYRLQAQNTFECGRWRAIWISLSMKIQSLSQLPASPVCWFCLKTRRNNLSQRVIRDATQRKAQMKCQQVVNKL